MKRNISFYFLVALALMLWSCEKPVSEVMIEKEISENWTFNQLGENQWLPATVPGTVHTDLLDNDKIEDPFYRLNELDLQWIDKVDWEYKTTFLVDKEILGKDVVELDFKGLDTYAEVSLNGTNILSADNMFREWNADVKDLLKEGENEIHILFKSPIVEGLKKHDALDFVYPGANNDQAERGQVEGNKRVSIFTRKAGYHYGWDWGPRLVTSGIYRPIVLKAWNKAKIENLQIIQNTVGDEKATFTAVFEIDAVTKGNAKLQIKNDENILAVSTVELQKGVGKYNVDFEIANPKSYQPLIPIRW